MADEQTPPAGQAPTPEGTPAPAAQPPAAPSKPWRNPRAVAAAKPATKPSAPAIAGEVVPAPEAPKPRTLQVPAKVAKELERLRGIAAEHDKVSSARATDVKRLQTYAKQEMAGLTDEQRAYIEETAGKDPGLQLDALAAMRKHKLLGVAATPAAKPDATNAPKGGPPAAKPSGPEDVLAKYEGLAKSAPIHAAAFLASNRTAIDAARKARGAN